MRTLVVAWGLSSVLACGADDSLSSEDTDPTASSDDATSHPSSDGDGDGDGDGVGGDEGGESDDFGEPLPPWHCGGVDFLGGHALVWAKPASLAGSVSTLRFDGEALDTSLDTMWSYQVEHWGPCLTVQDGYIGVVLAMGPDVMGEAQSQLRIFVAGGEGTYELANVLEGAGTDAPTVDIDCSTIVDGAYHGGLSEGAATGTLEVAAVPQADGEVLHVILDGSHGDGWWEYALDVQLTVPDGYFGD